LSSIGLFSQKEADSSGIVKMDPIGMTVEQFRQRTCVPNKLVLVNFKADWCVVCKKQKPLIDEIAREERDNVEVLEIDMDNNPLIAEHFEVDGLPINFLFKDGVVIWDRMGLATKKEIADIIRAYFRGRKMILENKGARQM
jgi:thioredoxin 1